jgi:hypothetical protein
VSEYKNNAWEDAAEAFDRATEANLTASERKAYWEAYDLARREYYADLAESQQYEIEAERRNEQALADAGMY